MKNNEDFSKVWEIEDQSKKHKIEEVYGTGRDIAGFISNDNRKLTTLITR